jgi:nitric oxide reductase large subunit
MEVVLPEEKLPEEKKVEKKKGAMGKLKDALIPDQEEQAAIISTFVRITVLAWSGGILTLNYVAIPGIPQQKIDPTFIASVFTGVLASFGIATASKKGDGTYKSDAEKPIKKEEIEALIAKAANTTPAQIIRVESGPLRIVGVKEDGDSYKL